MQDEIKYVVNVDFPTASAGGHKIHLNPSWRALSPTSRERVLKHYNPDESKNLESGGRFYCDVVIDEGIFGRKKVSPVVPCRICLKLPEW